LARIPVRSRRHAMDWSLVLVSQGIESTIENSPEIGGWALLVPPNDRERALKTLRQYRVENRSWNWKQPLDLPDTRFDWTCLVWAGAMILIYWLAARNPLWKSAGILDSGKVASGQLWRLVTAMTLHEDLAHLAENLAFGIILFGFVIGRYGFGTGLFAAGLAGILGNLLSLLLNAKPFHGLGASGMIMGALGLLSIIRAKRETKLPLTPSPSPLEGEKVKAVSDYSGAGHLGISFESVAAGVMLFVLYGLSPGTDLFAHLGGFCGGMILATFLAFLPKRLVESSLLNFINGLLLVLSLIVSWWLAFAFSV
jgi:membrane associated rhomboid family serine protease